MKRNILKVIVGAMVTIVIFFSFLFLMQGMSTASRVVVQNDTSSTIIIAPVFDRRFAEDELVYDFKEISSGSTGEWSASDDTLLKYFILQGDQGTVKYCLSESEVSSTDLFLNAVFLKGHLKNLDWSDAEECGI